MPPDKEPPPPPSDVEEALQPELDEALLALDELAQDDPEEALMMFETLPETVQALSDFQLVLARANQSLGQFEAARDMSEGILKLEPDNADAHHLLGDVLEDLGDAAGANGHFLRVLELDAQALRNTPEASVAERSIENVLRSCLDKFARARQKALNVEFLPSEQDIQEGMDPRALFDCSQGVTVFSGNVYAEFGDLYGEPIFEDHVRAAISDEVVTAFSLSAEEIEEFDLSVVSADVD